MIISYANERATIAGPERGAAGGEELVGRELRSYEDFLAAGELYVRVFGYRDPEFALNPNLLSALIGNGGSAVGVFAPEGRLVGFAYGFAGRDADGRDFHYSQSATVDPAYQGRGIGRELKQLQRRVARRWGHRTMRWTFDPVLVRNGHFNLSTLGAVGTAYLPDYYARSGTDRLLVEWSLDGGPDPYRALRGTPPQLGAEHWGVPQADGERTWLALPADPRRPEAERLRPALAASLRALTEQGRILIDCSRLDDETAVYLAVARHTATALPEES